jgi:hypothetical protein
MSNLKIAAALLLVLFAPLASRGQDDPKVKALIDKVLSPNADARFARAPRRRRWARRRSCLAGSSRIRPRTSGREAAPRNLDHRARSGTNRPPRLDGEPTRSAGKAVKRSWTGKLYPDKPVKVKREFLHLIAQVCDNEFVSSVAACWATRTRTFAGTARLALEQFRTRRRRGSRQAATAPTTSASPTSSTRSAEGRLMPRPCRS